jgi:glyceraldehyde 3-phosphate dehydrogenase
MLVGLNGFGRIGKCIFLLLLDNERIQIGAINAPDFNMSKLENYLKHDSVHRYAKDFQIEVVNNDCFRVNGRKVHLLRDRNAASLNWAQYNIDTVIDASGCYLTEEKAKQHSVTKIIMSAPAKDNTPLFVYGANHNLYHGESIISNASCTTNSITPILRHLEEKYGIKNANFTTIHASTASQKVVDTAHSKSRTDRSIFNNIIPHTTGASSSIYKVLPTLQDKVIGTSVRVPVNNVSLIDLNVELDSEISLEKIITGMKTDPYLEVCENNLVSSDFISSKCPSIVDKTACMHLGENRFKLMVWYDNEWSYANQLILFHRKREFQGQKCSFTPRFEFTNVSR